VKVVFYGVVDRACMRLHIYGYRLFQIKFCDIDKD
jgi:hypothetical protein